MPTNTFGPNDNYNTLNSHFFPSLIKKIHEIKSKDKNVIQDKKKGNDFSGFKLKFQRSVVSADSGYTHRFLHQPPPETPAYTKLGMGSVKSGSL